MYITKNMKVSTGVETTVGTAVTTTDVFPMKNGSGIIDVTANKTPDDIVIGTNADGAPEVDSLMIGGSLTANIRPCPSIAHCIWSNLIGSTEFSSGDSISGQEIAAIMAINYSGSEASCKLVADTSGDTLTSYIGDLGSETVDAAFGTAGVIDLTDPSTDTLTELAAVINGYTDYTATIYMGAGTVSTADIISYTTQAAGRQAVFSFSGSSTSVYEYNFYADLTATAQRALTVKIEGSVDNKEYAGNVVNNVSVTGSEGGMVTATVDFMGFTEENTAVGASGLSFDDVKSLRFFNGETWVDNTKFCKITTFTFGMNHNNGEPGTGQCNDGYGAYHKLGMMTTSADFEVVADADSELLRERIKNNTLTSVFTYSTTGEDLGNSLKPAMFIEMDHMALSTQGKTDNNNVIDQTFSFVGGKPPVGQYNPMCRVKLIMSNSSV